MGKITDLIFFRNHCLCPRWICFTFDNALRRLVQDPDRMMRPYIKEGDVVLDIGPGIGYFTIPMARMVGERGRVIAADIQEPMLRGIQKRAQRAGVQNRIKLHLAGRDALGVTETVDFILAFWMAHEVPDESMFFAQLYSVLKEGGRFLLAEPKLHVTRTQFEAAIEIAEKVGFKLLERPGVSLSLAALFTKSC
jgi:ubiquinone/menaquinone biosynthesis C-methylase UbiE